jgi:hypothetical protein
MTLKINKEIYIQLIESDIDILQEYIPEEYSIERDHIIMILRESIDFNYPKDWSNEYRGEQEEE